MKHFLYFLDEKNEINDFSRKYSNNFLHMFSFSAVNLGCSKNLVDLEFAVGEILKYS